VTVPLTALRKVTEIADFRDTTTPYSVSRATGTTTDPLTVIAIETLSQAVGMLREDLGTANRRVDARTAAMISGCAAAALRSRLELLTDERRRRWWRRWFK
jgi:hypothetical protein